MASSGQASSKPSRTARAAVASDLAGAESAGVAADAAEIASAQDRFISFWGEMGTRWGVQRSMAEVHALLFIAGDPLSAEDVMERLRLSRGSVSTVLRQLVEWGLIQRVRAKERSDRREYFQAEQDVWKLFYTILRARKRREFDPLVEELGGCRVVPRGGRRTDREKAHDRRIDELLELCVFFDGLANTISKSGKGIERATRLLSRVLGGGK